MDKNKNYLELLEKNKQLKKICERYKLVLEGSNDGIWEWDIPNNVYKVSSKDKEIFDYKTKFNDFTIEIWQKTLHPDDRDQAVKKLTDFLKGKKDIYENIYRMQNKNGSYRWVLSKGKGIKGDDGKVICIAGSHTDITEKRELEDKLYNLAYSDYLTKLSNREKLYKDFKTLIKKGTTDKDIVFFYLDIDEFGYVNNTLGYDEGNKLIKRLGKFLIERYGDDHHIARLGADEFIVMYIQNQKGKCFETELSDLLEEIKNEKFFDNQDIVLTVSIGAAKYLNHGKDFYDLIRKADTALYFAKRNGKDQFQIYSPDMGEQVYRTIDLINQIRIAIEKKEFEMYYQPVFEVQSREITGFEALIRWNNPTSGFISPLEFIPVAEVSGQMVTLEKWIFDDVFKQVKKWEEQGKNAQFVSINLSAKGLLENDIILFLKELLEKYEINPQKIEFEVTETAMIKNLKNSVDVLTKIRELGFTIALDDFGTGYSSLTYLNKLPISKVKLDKNFVHGLNNERDCILIKSIIELSKNLKLQVVAEGVETLEEQKLLEEMDCDYLQGFLLGKPQTISSLEKEYKK